MKESDAQRLVDAMNEILKQKPIGKVEFDEKYEELIGRLRQSEWRPIVSDFTRKNNLIFGQAHLSHIRTVECNRIYGTI